MAIKTPFRAPADWKDRMHWYVSVTSQKREAFARRFCTTTFVIPANGNTGVVVSYPRLIEVKQESLRTRSGVKRVKKVMVRVYDMDGAGFHWMTLEEVKIAVHSRKVEERDFQWDAIMGSLYCDEAADIGDKVIGE
jgi:hypothetical protein